MRATIIILTICLSFVTYQNLVYQALVPKLLWSNDTLHMDWMRERGLYLGCKNMVRK